MCFRSGATKPRICFIHSHPCCSFHNVLAAFVWLHMCGVYMSGHLARYAVVRQHLVEGLVRVANLELAHCYVV
jgi:hypothetical protein